MSLKPSVAKPHLHTNNTAVTHNARGVGGIYSNKESDNASSTDNTSNDAPNNKQRHSGSVITVLIAIGANLLIAIAKSFAAFITGSASMIAEAAHSWADTGNGVFLLIAEKKAVKPADTSHPLGYGKESYVWSMIAAFGVFMAGSIVSIYTGISE